jgi:Domain of unknown function (DUF4157)
MTTGKIKSIEKTQKAPGSSLPSLAFARQRGPSVSHTAFDAAMIPQMAGNLAVQQLFRAGGIQAKLEISQPGDPAEEADRVADQVMRMAEPVPIGSAPSAIQRKCVACDPGVRCPKCEEKTIHKKAAPGHLPEASPGVSSKIAFLRAGGQPLPAATSAFFEHRFGTDFSQVRVHTGGQDSETAHAIQARAFTTGQDMVFGAGQFAPESAEGKRLLAHELVHVVQQGAGKEAVEKKYGSTRRGHAMRSTSFRGVAPSERPPAATVSSLSRGNVVVTQHTQPAIQRDIDFTGTVAQLGIFTIKGHPVGTSLGAHEDVKITFSPDAQSPVAEAIDFVQTARSPGSERPGDWARTHPKEKLKDDSATTAGSGLHQTQQGETLAMVSQQHYGTTDKAAKILDENRGRLVWWLAELAVPPDDQLNRPLPVGVLLKIPDAIQGGVMVDIHPDDILPRSNRTDPNISPNYPGQGEMMPLPNHTIGRINGFKRADGSKHDASMTDRPGGGPISGHFEFESAAFAKDIGLIYGAVRWGFLYSSSGITNESAALAPKVSDTFNAAIASFNRVYKNKHTVQKGETLNSISILYFGSIADAHRIYMLNRTNPALPTDDPTVAIAGGTQLDVGLGPSIWDKVKGAQAEK